MTQEDRGKIVRKYFERLTASDYVGKEICYDRNTN